jgi:hypothetical protein
MTRDEAEAFDLDAEGLDAEGLDADAEGTGADDQASSRRGGRVPAALPADAERLLAGTLALMTSFYRCPHTAVCRKLLDNLTMLSRHPQLSERLQRVCRNAGARWAAYLEEVEQAVAEVDSDDDEDDCDDGRPLTLH